MKTIREGAASATLLIASLLAHILAGGATLSLKAGTLLLFLSLLIARVLRKRTHDPIAVTIAIFSAQNLGHFIAGGQSSSDTQMLCAHIASGVMSYQLLRYFDENLPCLGDLFLRHFLLKFFRVTPRIHRLCISPFESLNFSNYLLNLSGHLHRGPPLN